RGQVCSHADGQGVGDAAAKTEAHGADFPSAIVTGLQPPCRGLEILDHFVAIDLRKQFPGLVFIVWVAPHGGESIRRESDEILSPEPPGDVLDVWVQTAVLMHDQHPRQLATCLCRTYQVAADVAIALRRGNNGGFRLDPAIIFRDLLSPREMRAQAFEERRRRQAADGKLIHAPEELTAVDMP